MQQQPALTPQQEAIREVRARYEQGILTFEQFEYALNALLQAQTPEQCEGIVSELPSSLPSMALDVAAPQPAPPATRLPRSRWIVAIMGGVQRLRRPWKLAEHTQALMLMGGMELDLNLAALPEQGTITIVAVMGGAKIYVPRSIEVSVHGLMLLGGVNVLGEGSGGIIAFANEEVSAYRASAGAVPHLSIQVFTLMGGVGIVQAEGPVIAGGLLATPQPPLLLSPVDRHAEHRAAYEARRAARRAERVQRD